MSGSCPSVGPSPQQLAGKGVFSLDGDLKFSHPWRFGIWIPVAPDFLQVMKSYPPKTTAKIRNFQIDSSSLGYKKLEANCGELQQSFLHHFFGLFKLMECCFKELFPPKTNSKSPWKIIVGRWFFLLEWSPPFRGHSFIVHFRGGGNKTSVFWAPLWCPSQPNSRFQRANDTPNNVAKGSSSGKNHPTPTPLGKSSGRFCFFCFNRRRQSWDIFAARVCWPKISDHFFC